MEPLSITLSVVTLATAIKDIIELAERIESSFAKVSQNLRNAQNFATEIRETLNQLKEFCEQHQDMLNLTKETETAVRKLHTKMDSVHTECLQLLQASSEKSLGRFRISLQAWKNRNKTERRLSDLKIAVNKCYTDFMLLALIRIDARVSCMAHMRVSDQNVIVIAESSPSTSNIGDDIISTKYLRIQIASIRFIADSLINQPSRMHLFIPETTECYILPFEPLLDSSFLPGDQKKLHRDVVARSLVILNILENESAEVSSQKGAWDLVNFTIGLHYLYMHEEAVTMGQCTVNLFRALVSVDRETYTPYLIHSLQHLSIFYEDINNLEEAFHAIEEAARLSRALQIPRTPVQLRIQYGGTLTTYARAVYLKMDYARAIGSAGEAVKLLEEIIQIDNIPYEPYTKINGIVDVNQDFLIHLFHESGASHQAICNYARALHQLSNCLSAGCRPQECLDLKLRALSIFQIMSGMHTESTLDIELAGILFELISQECKKLLPPEKLLGYAEKCITIYRKYIGTDDTTSCGRFLCDSLSEKANILEEMQRDDETLEAWKEIAELAKVVEDRMYLADVLYQVSWSCRRLKRYNEAASMRTESIVIYQSLAETNSSEQAHGYYDLSVDLRLAGRFQEAVQAAQKAVTQYRALAFRDPDTWAKEIGRGLSALADSYLSAGDCSGALANGHEAMNLFEKLISTDPTIIHSYIYCLKVNFSVAFTSDNESRAIELSKDILRHFRALRIKYPTEVALGVWDAELELGQNLNRVNLITKARSHVEELLSKLDDKHRCDEKAEIVNLRIRTLILYAEILDSQGYPELAFTPIFKAIEIGTPLSASNGGVASQTVSAMYHHAQLLSKVGRNTELLEVGLKTSAFARITKLDNPGDFVGSLHAVALAAVKNCKPGMVVGAAQEAVDVCRRPVVQEYMKINRRTFFLLPKSLGFLANGLSAVGKPAEGLVHAQAALEEATKLKSVPRISWADAEPVYMMARDCLADILLDNGKIAHAIDLLVDLRQYYTERVKHRTGVYAELVRTLRRLGILYCSVGRHEGGISAANELSMLKARLTTVFPSFMRLLDFNMEGTLRKADLKCHHQHIHVEGRTSMQARD